MAKKPIKDEEEEEQEGGIEEISDYFEWNLIPINAPSENKTGITFKGRDAEYIQAHKSVQKMMKVRGERYMINGVEIAVVDAPKNKPSVVDVKPRNGLSGKANVKIYDMNKNGGATMYINQRSGSSMVHVKTLAFKVIKFLLEKLMSGDIEENDIEKFKMSGTRNRNCKEGEKITRSPKSMKIHIEKDHSVNEKSSIGVKCNICEYICKSERDMEKHKDTEHAEVLSPRSKRCKPNYNEQEEVIASNIDEEPMDVDYNILSERSRVQDDKVLSKRMKDEEKELRFQEEKSNQAKIKIEEEKKRKRQMSIEKKKSKKKSRKESVKDIVDTKSKVMVNKNNTKEIDVKYEAVFAEAGIDIKQHVVYSVKPDGACGSNCASLHCHRDQSLGQYVRSNTNEYIVSFWPFFKDFYSFPMSQKVGSKNRTFKTEEEYLKFLKTDKKAALLWMDHPDLQAVCNQYQINIHILTTDVVGIKEPRARWTHMVPDSRLIGFSKIKPGLPDMWLVHVDEIHFDLIIPKDSDLAKEGSLDDLRLVKEDTNKHGCKTCDNSFESTQLLEEHLRKHELKENSCRECDKKFGTHASLRQHEEEHNEVEEIKEDQTIGPGYMGWKIEESNKIDEPGDKVKKLEKGFFDLKIAYEKLEKIVENQNNEKRIDEKKRKGMENEIKQLKTDFKQCMEAIKAETYARNKAEELVKVLKETISAQKERIEVKKTESFKDKIEEMDTDMEVEEVTEAWEKPRNRKRKHNNSYKKGETLNKHYCKKCEINFISEEKLTEHVQTHRGVKTNKSGAKQSENELLLREYPQDHAKVNGENCDESKVTLNEKVKTQRAPQEEIEMFKQQKIENEFNCNKCDRKYNDMNKLRRHDWRNHREIECNICCEILSSRQEIGEHRKEKHAIFTTKTCKFFPECYDEDECFFEHKSYEKVKNGCPNGQNCSDQTCKFSAWGHREKNQILCKFQEKCNRSNCIFRHIVAKKCFLGEGLSKDKLK